MLSEAKPRGAAPSPGPSSELEAELAALSGAGQLPLLSLQTTNLSFSTLTRVLFRIAFRYK